MEKDRQDNTPTSGTSIVTLVDKNDYNFVVKGGASKYIRILIRTLSEPKVSSLWFSGLR
jgi:hypothetical protein